MQLEPVYLPTIPEYLFCTAWPSVLESDQATLHCEADKKEPIFFYVHLFQYLTETGEFFGIYLGTCKLHTVYLIWTCIKNFE